MHQLVIEVENLTKTFPGGNEALRGLNFQVREGERVGIMGRSGAGKTTLLRLLNGSILPSGGRLKILGRSMGRIRHRQLRKLRSKIAVIQQNYNVVPGMTVVQNVLMGRLGQCSLPGALRMILHPTGEERDKVFEILEELEIEDKMYQPCQDISGGQQQRVAVARALIGSPEIILADEPIASVDSRTAGVILKQLSRLNERKGVTVIINLHQPDFAINFCSRILIMDRGFLIYDGDPREAKELVLKQLSDQRKEGDCCESPPS